MGKLTANEANVTPGKHMNDDGIEILDGRQSPTAARVQRGVARFLVNAGHAPLFEFSLASGRRADVFSIGPDGEIWIVEIKSSLADFQADHKWPEYRDFCDRLFFARPLEVDEKIFPLEAGLIVADAYGAEVSRWPDIHRLNAARRKAVTLRFAHASANRLLKVLDPGR